MASKPDKYVGIDNDINGGMTTIGKIIRDAWVFEIIPETETCKGWLYQGIDDLRQKVDDEWDKYGCLVSSLPPELRERHERIHNEAIKKAREHGWNGDFEISQDE